MRDPFPNSPVLRLGSGVATNATPTKAMDDLIADSADHLTDRDPGTMITGTVEAGSPWCRDLDRLAAETRLVRSISEAEGWLAREIDAIP